MSDLFKVAAAERLVKIADQMEMCEPGSPERKALAEDYKLAMVDAGITDINGNMIYKNPKDAPEKSKTTKSQKKCFEKIIKALDDFAAFEAEIGKMYISQIGHIAFSYLDIYKNMMVEIQFMIPERFYQQYSGYKAVKNRVNLVLAKQITGYTHLEYGLLDFTLGFLRGKRRKEFWEKYIVPYNKKIRELKEQQQQNKTKE